MPLKDLSKEEQKALRDVVCPGASDPHIDFFLRCCKARNVDPFSSQMYLQVRTVRDGSKRPAVSMSIDGARMQASRSNAYAGSDDIEYDSEEADHPLWARAVVWRIVKGQRHAFTGKVRWREFVPPAPADQLWKQKPYHMLGKVAEMQALRRAFPESVIDTTEEAEIETVIDDKPQAQSDIPPPGVAQAQAQAPAKVSAMQWNNALKAFTQLGKTAADMLAKVGLHAVDEVYEEQMETLRSWYNELVTEAEQAAGL